MKVKVINKSEHKLPEYETTNSAGLDIRANIGDKLITILPLERTVIPTGIHLELPIGTEAQVRPRSGLAAKQGVTVLNSPGTIDADFRGDIGVILVNLSTEPVVIRNGDRIAQLVFAKHEHIKWSEVEELSSTDRGENGFGSTGK